MTWVPPRSTLNSSETQGPLCPEGARDGIAVGASGNAYVGGVTVSDFPTTAGAFQTTYGGGTDAFVNLIWPLSMVSFGPTPT